MPGGVFGCPGTTLVPIIMAANVIALTGDGPRGDRRRCWPTPFSEILPLRA
jgi:hypothetical protein